MQQKRADNEINLIENPGLRKMLREHKIKLNLCLKISTRAFREPKIALKSS